MNSAGRLLEIYTRLLNANSGGNDVALVKRWAQVFELPADSPTVEDDVVTCLQAMRAELDLLKAKLQARGVAEDLLRPGFTRLRNISSTAYLNSGWNGHREEAARPENRIPFMWANWVLQDENEEDMPSDELASLRSELDALDKSLDGTDMTPYLRDFAQRQIDTIRSALKVYGVRGVKPVEEALQRVVGTITFEKERVQAEQEKASEETLGILARTAQCIEKTAKVADNLDKIRKAGEGAYSLAASVAPALTMWAQHLLK